MEDCFHLGVKALIFSEEGNVLLLRRRFSSKKGFWDIPGGRIQKGEALQEALAREVKEETGFSSLSDIQPFAMVVTDVRIPIFGGDVGLILSVFSCHVALQMHPLLSEEHDAFEWLSPSEAAQKLSANYPQEFVQQLSSLV